jgi:hypothetical protein
VRLDFGNNKLIVKKRKKERTYWPAVISAPIMRASKTATKISVNGLNIGG